MDKSWMGSVSVQLVLWSPLIPFMIHPVDEQENDGSQTEKCIMTRVVSGISPGPGMELFPITYFCIQTLCCSCGWQSTVVCVKHRGSFVLPDKDMLTASHLWGVIGTKPRRAFWLMFIAMESWGSWSTVLLAVLTGWNDSVQSSSKQHTLQPNLWQQKLPGDNSGTFTWCFWLKRCLTNQCTLLSVIKRDSWSATEADGSKLTFLMFFSWVVTSACVCILLMLLWL